MALIFEDERLTYAELDRRANQLAHYLRRLGVGSETRVGVLAERSTQLVVALLGILKAGAAYVPLDASHPPARLAFMLADARVRVLLTRNYPADKLPPHGARVVAFEAEEEAIEREDGAQPPRVADLGPDQLVYVMYTSGSTGEPKGVMVTHAGVVNSVWSRQQIQPLTAQDRTLLKTPLGFDASVWELFWPLSSGACVVIARAGGEGDTGYLRDTIIRRGVTTLYFVPSLLSVFIAEEGLEAATRVSQLICGGEPLPAQTARRFYERFPRARLHHSYGPTETSIGSTEWTCAPRLERPTAHVGRPVANTRLYVLDRFLNPVPVGVTGELFVGGCGVARGYAGRPAQTAERFVPDPFSGEPGARLYRTGDLVRYLNDGNVEFSGRADSQVKLRGLRVELGEVEAALSGHAAVCECAVVAREDAEGDKRLVAYVVNAPTESLAADELRGFLRSKLPEYMVPARYVYLAALPLLASGKVDRKALPAPEGVETQASEYQAPRTPIEEVVAGVWSEVLGVGRVGVRDNFFELGGHSLLATRVVSRVREALGVELALTRFFEIPVVEELAREVEAQLRAGGAWTRSALRAVPREGAPPLSFAQRRLWFLHQLEPDSPFYNTFDAVHLEGRLDVGALAAALSEVVRRHEVLRTTFRVLEGEPVQIISPPRRMEIPVVDLTCEAEREREAQRLASLEAKRPFDLAAGPVLRATLMRLGAEAHVLVLVLHHIVSDGWSVGVLVRELSALYGAYVRGEGSPLVELAVQYADYAWWQREQLAGAELERQLAYWRERLSGAAPVLELPTDRPRPAVPSLRGAAVSFELPGSLTEELKALGRREGATLFMTLSAAFRALLYRYTGQEDISVGTPIAGRTRAEVEPLVGFFVNTLVLRVGVRGAESFRRLLKREREACLGAYAHQDVPFERVVEELEPERDPSRTPLFQVMFVLQNVPTEAPRLAGLSLTEMALGSTTAKFDWMMSLEETGRGLRGVLEYSTDLFDEPTVRRALESFRVLLEGIARDAELPVSALPLLTPEDERRMLFEWNDTAVEFPRGVCVHELFEAQAEHTPEATAVVCGGERLSYRELNTRACQLADYLRTRGVGPESVVGVMFERSSEMVVALLGILKAGAAYVPLDAEHPPSRLAFMLEDARVQVLLTQERLRGRLPEHDARTVCLDTDWMSIVADDAGRPAGARVGGGNLVYVIYTSGSTGRPKAVMMPHAAAVNLIKFQLQSDAAPRPPRTLQFASLSFDVSFQEIFSTLCAGATLVLIDEEARRDAAELLRVSEAERVERLFLPFVALQSLAEAAEVRGTFPSSLLEVITAGEQLKITPHIERLFDRLGHALLDNHYGPTETHLATMWRLAGAAREWPPLPPIGRPIANARVYVLDVNGCPVPAGVTGELYVGGAQLARGYLNRPAQTAERFVPDSFSGEPGARLYRTGDLVRYLNDGRLEYVGRSDQQVKVRGFRVEIGEVEAALKRHAAVGQAAVAAFADKTGGRRLVAYVVRAQGTGATTGELRDFLKERLPEYMMPARYVYLAALPLLASGKVDRKALPAPEGVETRASEFVAPRTPIEEAVAGVWSEVLGVGRVGVRDNFFELGGHSLLATRLITRLRDIFQVEIPLRYLFQQPTPAGLAQSVEAELSAGKSKPLPPVRAVARDGAAPLSFAQQRLWFLDRLEPGSAFYNLPAALWIEGALDTEALERSLAEIIRRHEILRTTFPVIDGRPAQLLSPDASLCLKQLDLGHLAPTEMEEAVRQHAQEEARRPFDLGAGPVLRATLMRLGAEAHVLVLVMHHIVSDGWSVGVLVRELSALYGAYVRGEGSPLGELPIQYADYAWWQRERLAGAELERQLAYWRERLSGAAPVLELPTDRPRPAVQTYRGGRHAFALPASVAEEIRALSRRAGATLFMTLLAAFQTLLQRHTGQEEVSVGTPIAGRGRAETADLIGFFVNTLVLRTGFDGDPTFAELLARVREVCLGAYSHQEVPFERVVEELQPERDLSRTPLFQALFVLQHAPIEPPHLAGLELRALEIGDAAARFDLTLETTETGEGLRGEFIYNADLFEAATVARMSEHFANLLRAVASGPDERVSRLQLSSPEELRQLLAGWDSARTDYPRGRCVQELFEAQAERTPDALAVRSDEESLSYRELNERANRLARYLRRLGVGPESKVGVRLERSAEMVVCLLGVLKAGAAYVPLSPAYPRERLAFLLADAGVRVLLRRKRRAGEETPDVARVVALEDERELIAREGRGNLPATATPDNLAYVIYTSGSTGRPKGVEVTHHGLAHSTQARLAFYGEGVRCFLLVSPFVFDSSVAGIFWTLCAGGVLALPPEDFQRDLPRFVASVARHGVSHLLCLPSLYALLLEQGTRAEFETLRTVIVAGEVCPGQLVGRHFETLPRTLLFNEYGPTEGTVWSTVHQCLPEDSAARVPIGRPVAGVRAYVLDAGGRLAPRGVVGELYVGGAQLARGYLNRPAQTAERFVPDSFSGEPGARLYRTGDLVRYLNNGRLEFLGRADEQLKIRGFRVEPGEIEATLVSHAGVREALVVAREEGGAVPRLIGYVVACAAPPPTVGELRAFLKERLPEHMTPAAFVVLEELPRTTSGKPDRRRLPAPDAARPTLDAVYVAPRTKLEQEVAAVWREVLRLEKVGVQDNFFDLGGHSLLIVEAHLKLRDRLGREIPVVDLFSHPTIEALANHLGREEGEPPAETDGSRRAAARRASLGERARGRGAQRS